MNEEEKEIIQRIQQDSTFRERSLLRIIKKQQAEIETLKRDFEIVDHECSRLEKEDIKKDLIINEMAEEIASYNHYEALGKLEDKEEVIEYFNQKIEKGE